MRLNKESFFRTVFLVGLLAACITGSPANAQPAPAVPPPADAALEAARRAFEALPEADRKAIQDSLIWTGDYKAIASGRFGKATRDAIVAFALRSKLPGDGTLDEKGRTLLVAAAQRTKTAVGFSLVTDERAGVKIGVPSKLLSKIGATKNGARYASSDDKAVLETSLVPESEATLEQRFDMLRAETAQRKVTYKVLRPDFFVVAGETTGTIFYTRMSRAERAGEKMLVGYTLTYPAAAKATYDIIAIAVANSFEPLPANPPVVAAEHGVTDTTATTPYLAANGLVIASGLVLTSLPANACHGVQIGGRAAKVAQQEQASGLTLLELANLTGPAISLRGAEPKADLPVVMLAYAAKAASLGRSEAAVDDLVAAPGQLRQTASGMRVLTSVQGVRAGGVVFDRFGMLVGLLAAESAPEKRVGDVAPIASRPMIAAAALGSFLGSKRPKEAGSATVPSERSLGDIVAESRAAVVPIYCVP